MKTTSEAKLSEQTLADLTASARKAVAEAADLDTLEATRVRYLGKKGLLTEQLKMLGKLPPDKRVALGRFANEAKQILQADIQAKTTLLKKTALEAQLLSKAVDVSLPGRFSQVAGSLHPVKRVQYRLEEIFTAMGFDVLKGLEIEDDFHNFTALNIPAEHPARAMHDTFYLKDSLIKNLLLRTHTSPMQVRKMMADKPPIHVVVPGRVYRRDADPTHSPMFHQLEGLWVDEHVSFTDLRGLLEDFLQRFFERRFSFRFRPSYFPFTEPSAEVDVECLTCQGKGCKGCKYSGWLEILGCGMVHPNVFKHVGIDNERYTGFAFGIGIDRLAMLRYGVDDLRVFFDNDLRFLAQFV